MACESGENNTIYWTIAMGQLPFIYYLVIMFNHRTRVDARFPGPEVEMFSLGKGITSPNTVLGRESQTDPLK